LPWLDKSRPAKAAKKERRRKPREEFVDYVVAIEDWGWSYSPSLDTDRHAADPYREFSDLQIRGHLLHPKGMKTDQVEITLLPSYDLLPEARKERQPRCVGSLDIYGDRIAGLVSIPMDALPPILQMLIGGRFQFISMRDSAAAIQRASARPCGTPAAISQAGGRFAACSLC
jgi:hypothetical protein